MRGRTAPGESAKAPETAAEQAKPCFSVRGPPGLSLEAGPAAGQIGSAAAPGGPGFRRSGSNREKGAGVLKRGVQHLLGGNPSDFSDFFRHITNQRGLVPFSPAGDRRHVRRVGFQQKAVQWDSSGGLYRMAGVFKGYRASKAEIQSQLYRLAGGLDAARKAVENPFGLVLLQQLHGVPMGLPVMDNNGQSLLASRSWPSKKRF